MQSLIIAFAMYSKIPMPRADWNDKNMRYAFCWFPVIGLVIGLVELAVFYILTKWQAGSVFRGVCLMAVPLLVTGGCQKFLWRQGEKAGNFKGFPCGGLCGDRLQLLSDFVGRGLE